MVELPWMLDYPGWPLVIKLAVAIAASVLAHATVRRLRASERKKEVSAGARVRSQVAAIRTPRLIVAGIYGLPLLLWAGALWGFTYELERQRPIIGLTSMASSIVLMMLIALSGAFEWHIRRGGKGQWSGGSKKRSLRLQRRKLQQSGRKPEDTVSYAYGETRPDLPAPPNIIQHGWSRIKRKS